MTISNPSLTQISQALAEMLPKLKPLSVPTGMISSFHDVPDGWLQCNGAAVSRTTYAALFAVIGTKYGSGDGSTTFNLPNLHHKFIEGTTTTSEVGTYVEAGLPNITGDVWHIAGTSGTGIGGGESGAMYRTKHGGSDVPNGQTGGSSGYDGVAIDASKISSVYSSASTVQPSSLRTLMCIKT